MKNRDILKRKKLQYYFWSFISLILLPVLGYFKYIHFIGFPDGHFTPYEEASRLLYKIGLAPFVLPGFYFLYRSFSSKPEKSLLPSITILITLFILFLIVDYTLYINLPHGQGG